MIHPITDLQSSILAALSADSTLIASIGADAIFDMPPKGKSPPFGVIVRHDLIARDADLAPGNDHRVHIQIWHPDPSRAAVLMLAERIVEVVISSDLSTVTLTVTHVQHDRTESTIDRKSGQARALLVFKIFSEPAV